MSIYITSDLHFGHNKEFVWQARGYNSVEDMNAAQIIKWNECVTHDDEVWVLGDSMLNDNTAGIECIKQLKGKIHMIAGNHDTDARIKLYEELGIDVHYAYRLKYKKKLFMLSHYPTITANEGDERWQATINIHGHTHQTQNFTEGFPFMYHAGIDSHYGYPVLLDNIINEIEAHWKNLEMGAQKEI